MQFENRLPGDGSSRRLINQRDQTAIFLRYSAAEAGTRLGGPAAASAPRVWPYRESYRPSTQDQLNGDGRALRTSSDDAGSRRAIFATASGMMARVVEGLAGWGETAFPRLLFAVMSWMMAQALAGCIAYAEAMYSVDLSDPVDGRHPAAGPQPEREDRDQLRGQTSSPGEISPIANSGIEGNSPLSRQTPSGAVAPEAAYVVLSEMAPRGSFGRRASIRSLLAKFRPRMRRERDSGLAIAELRALDDRMLRDLGISRCDIESFERRGDVCE